MVHVFVRCFTDVTPMPKHGGAIISIFGCECPARSKNPASSSMLIGSVAFGVFLLPLRLTLFGFLSGILSGRVKSDLIRIVLAPLPHSSNALFSVALVSFAQLRQVFLVLGAVPSRLIQCPIFVRMEKPILLHPLSILFLRVMCRHDNILPRGAAKYIKVED